MQLAAVTILSLWFSWALAETKATPSYDPSNWPAEVLRQIERANQTHGEPAFWSGDAQAVIASTTGPLAIHAGARALAAGGTAADALVLTALAQIVLSAGSWNSVGGVLYALYYDAQHGRILALDAGFDLPRGETDAASIPGGAAIDGRSVLVGGFAAGLDSLHGRYGRLPWDSLVEPAIYYAEQGFPLDPMLARFIEMRREVILSTGNAREIFLGEDGELPTAGDRFRQPALAKTLRALAKRRSSHMYTGPWAREFVRTVREAGGRISEEDLALYQARWVVPLQAAYHGHIVHTLDRGQLGSVQLAEALNLLEIRGLEGKKHYLDSAQDLFRLIQTCRLGLAVSYSPLYLPLPSEDAEGRFITPEERVDPARALANADLLEREGWEAEFFTSTTDPARIHSDATVVRDIYGNVAVMLHSINTSLWGSTGLFVDGVSVPDPGSFQQGVLAKIRPGERLPNIPNPVIVTRDGEPRLAACTIGNAVHSCMVQHLVNVIDHGMSPAESLAKKKFWAPWWDGEPEEYELQAVDADAVEEAVRAELAALGQPLRELREEERALRIAYWVGVRFDQNGVQGAISPKFNGTVEGVEPGR